MEQNKTVKMRESGIELLRILMILQVIFLHVCSHGGYRSMAHNFSTLHKIAFNIIFLSSRCPVYVYILIFGYFAVTSNKTLGSIKSKIARIYLPMLFYSISIPFIGQLLGLWQLNDTQVTKSFFPFLSRTWYFLTLYLLVLILSPFVNRALTALSKKEYTQLVVILFLVFTVWTSLAQFKQTSDIIHLNHIFDPEGKSLYGFLLMYVLGGYLRLHVPSHEKARYRYLVAFVALTLINVTLCQFIDGYSKISGFNNNPFAVLQCLCLLMFFRDLKFKSRVINYIASVNLGVYMIHVQYLIRNKLWYDWFGFLHDKSFYIPRTYPFKIILICVIIFIACGIIERLRVWLFKGVSILYRKISAYKRQYD